MMQKIANFVEDMLPLLTAKLSDWNFFLSQSLYSELLSPRGRSASSLVATLFTTRHTVVLS